METKEERYMRLALAEAESAFEEDEVPIGAVIVHKGRIIAKAHNQIKTLKDPTAHAEMIAITQAANYFKNERLLDAVMYVTIEPCAMCVGAAILARLKAIVYGASDPKAGACGSVIDLCNQAKLNHRISIKKGMLEKEAKEIIQKFFKKKRKPKTAFGFGQN